MIPRNEEIGRIVDASGGLNLADSPNNLKPNQCLKLKNFVFGKGNMVEVKPGYTLDLALEGYGSSQDTGWNNPTSEGKIYSEWFDADNAYEADSIFSLCRSNETQDYYTFSLSSELTAAAIIDGIELDIKGKVELGTGDMDCYLSKDGGVSWTDELDKETVTFDSTNQYQSAGGSSNLWGDTWTKSDFGNNDFLIKLIPVGFVGQRYDIDHVRVKVTYREAVSGGRIDGIFRYEHYGYYYNIGTFDGYFFDTEGAVRNNRDIGGSAQFLTDGAVSNWAEYREIIYHSNGEDAQLAYRRSVWLNTERLRETGLAVPIALTSGSTTDSGGNLPDGTYKALWTLELADGVVVEGNPNDTAISQAVSNSGDNKITWSITDPDAEGNAKYVNLYVTDTDKDTYYFLKSVEIVPGANTYEWSDYTLLDVSSINQLQYDNYRPPIGGCNRMFNGYMFIADVNGYPQFGYVSKYGRYEQFPGAVAQSRSGGDPVSSAYVIDFQDDFVGAERAMNGGLIILCKKSVKLLSGYSADTVSLTTLSDGEGCANKKSIAVSPNGLVFWKGYDSIYFSDGVKVYDIGRLVWSEFENLVGEDDDDIVGYFWKHCYRICYPSVSALGYGDKELMFDTRRQFVDLITQRPTFAANGPHEKISVNCFTRGYKQGHNRAYFGSGDNAAIYRYDYGTDYDGTDIISQYESGYQFPGGLLADVRFHSIAMEMFPTSNIPSLIFEINYGTFIKSAPLTTPVSEHVWLGESGLTPLWLGEGGTGLYWGGDAYRSKVIRLGQGAHGRVGQIKIQVTNTDDINFAFRNLMYSYTILRRVRSES